MNAQQPQRDPATERQIRVADPTASTWLSANAGSGKTRVLTDRVARLLLGGTEPQKILCLTYTKAAAGEMQNRLLRRLGGWVMLEDAGLRAELARLGEDGAIDADRLARARRLFAQAIEAPGGLKIQTIHSFCGALLRRFPLEAGAPHGFSELDERSARDMRAEIVEEIASGPDRAVFDALAEQVGGDDIGPLINAVSAKAAAFAQPVARDDLLALFGLPAGFARADLPGLAFQGAEKALFDAAIPILRSGSKTMQDLAATLAGADLARPDLAPLFGALLTKDGAPRKKIPTVKVAEEMGEDLTEDFHAFMARLARARDAGGALRVVERSLTLDRFARAFLPRYRARKAAGGWLDFDDLIEKAGALLSDGSVAQWVLFRLDGGIDHILVDEAQDTSPGQWRVIESLADEFTAGEGAREAARTIFVVGDRKQSIYSFQGADLRRFEDMRALFSAKFAAIGRPLRDDALLHSFRSSPAILDLVDAAFAGPAAEGLGGRPEHLAFHADLPGRVDLWSPVEAPEAADPGDWEDPVDLPGAEDANVVLARAVAAEIRAILAAGTQIPDGAGGARPAHEGDFLILVQRRSLLFSEVIRACKAAGLAVAGADRLRLGAEIAVKDIVSLLNFLATPEDDLSLAEALRSPILGWSERDLYRLAQPRRGFLWSALRESRDRPETVALLQDLRDQTDFLRPFDLIERLLNRHGARERLIARLGAEAEDGIDELSAQALAYEATEIPSLTGFLGWLGADEIEVKRQLPNEGRMIRVMTVHGSKGLEAPIVILPDAAKPRAARASEVVAAPDGRPLWRAPAATGPAPEALGAMAAEAAARQQEERMRLFYVALTRAEKWLIVAAAGETGEAEDGGWHALTADAMARLGAAPADPLSDAARALGPMLRYARGDWPGPAPAAAPAAAPAPAPDAAPAAPALPDWALARAPRGTRPPQTLSPSDLGGAKALPGETDLAFPNDPDDVEGAPPDDAAADGPATGRRLGRLIHRLLETLPGTDPEGWPALAETILAAGPEPATGAAAAQVLATARPALDRLAAEGFDGPDCLAEVEVSAALAELGGARVHGAIDRLRVRPNEVHILDYKSNAVVPPDAAAVPLGILRQLAAYRAAVMQIYPGRQVRASVLWTRTGALTPLADAQMEDALRTAPRLDGPGGRA